MGLDCLYCEQTFDRGSTEFLKQAMTGHLIRNHRQELEDEFANEDEDFPCEECDSSLEQELVCPNCGKDHAKLYTNILITRP